MTLQQLNEHLNMVLQLEEAKETLASLRSQVLGAQKYDGMPHAQEASRKTEILAVILQQQDEDVKRLEKMVQSSEREVKDFIDSIDDNRTKIIFELRFLCGYKWEAVAIMVGGRNTTEAFEKQIDEAFAYYKAKGYAQVDKTPEPTKIIKRLEGGKFIAVFSSKAQPDYSGTLKGGRSVKFEAKYTTSDRITAERVTDNQAKYLTNAAALGAYCYILAGFSSGNVYKIPWKVWSGMKEYFGRKYIKETDLQLQQYFVPVEWNGILAIFS